MSAPTLTVERLREVLHYDPVTGIFTWRMNRPSGVKAGDIAGAGSRGYILIGIDGKSYKAHRLAWFFVTGSWPVDKIDHRDTDRSNNRFLNLRPADDRLNQQNKRRAAKNNRAGFLGVTPMQRGTFKAQIKTAGVNKYLGYFATPEEAYAAYVVAKRVLHAGNTL